MALITRDRSDLRGIAFAVAAAISFGTLAISAKLGYRAGAGPIPLLATRFAVAVALLASLQAMRRDKVRPPARSVIRLMLLGAFGYAAESALFFAALENAPASVVGLVFYSYPMWTALLGLAARLDRFRPQLLLALLLGSAGVAIVFSREIERTGAKGPLLALAAAVAVALFLIGIQVWTEGIDATSSALWTSAGAGLALLVAWPLSGQSLPLGGLPSAAALGLASATAFVLLYAAIARLGSSRAAVATMVEPVATVILAAAFLGEPISIQVLGGAALIVAALPVLAMTGRDSRIDAPPVA
ncbi:MAG: DMT family transporter [Actinomycetota bacterium]|nr:DMT family transporter [Actinomycetota bacterium]